jgi:sec-independent protein translocase protein TatC
MNSFFFHTYEIKYRCIYMCIGFFFTFIACCFTIYPILFYMIKPLKIIPNVNIMVTDLLEFWVVIINLASLVSFFLFFLQLLYNIWAFLLPSLFPSEKKLFNNFLRISCSSFIIGNVISFYCFLPLVISHCFQEHHTVSFLNLQYMPKLSNYISFLNKYFLFSFCCFQTPVFFVTLIEYKVLTYKKLSRYRKISYIFFLVVSSFLSPPDVISQILLTLILIFIMELIIIYSCWGFHLQKKIIC